MRASRDLPRAVLGGEFVSKKKTFAKELQERRKGAPVRGLFGLGEPMVLLFEVCKIKYGDWESLTWALADNYVPGFGPVKGGRPRALSARNWNELIKYFMEPTTENGKKSDRQIAKELTAKLSVLSPGRKRSPSAETLRKFLPRARQVAQQRLRAQSPERQREIGRLKIVRLLVGEI